MPPLVCSSLNNIIDGIHRLHALKRVGLTHFKAFIGSNKLIEKMKLENFMNNKINKKNDFNR